MCTLRHACVAIAVVVPALVAPLFAQPEDSTQSALAAMRAELAELRLAVGKIQAERDDLMAFLKQHEDGTLDEQYQRWRQEREQLEEQRRQLANERTRLDQARRELHQTTVRQANDAARADEQQKRAQQQQTMPDWSVQTMVGLLEKENDTPTVFVRIGNDLLVAADSANSIDYKRAVIRGNFLNKSLAPWRYTFLILVLDESGNRIGQWRYQTPELGAGDLHTFDVTMPVEDVRRITAIQIARVTADRPTSDITPPTQANTRQPLAPTR